MSAVFNSTGHHLELPEIVSSEGVYVFDGGGNRYMDLGSGVWCTSLGHHNRRINDAIVTQMDVLTHAGFCYSNPIVEEAATAVLSICGLGDGAVVFLCSGSEGIDYARQASRKITGRTLSLSFHDAYLGSFSSVIDRSSGWSSFDWERCGRCPGGTRLAECDHLDEIPDGVSEFLFEPGSSAGQVRFAPVQLVRRVVDRVRANGGKIIANEVTTGIGRTGSWFGFDHYGITPDLIVIGKGIGNGYPVSAVVMNRQTADELAGTDFKYMQSHQNDPLGAAVVKAVIATIEDESLIERSAANGAACLEALEHLVSHRAVVAVRGRGSMFAVDLADEATCKRVFRELLDHGFIVCPRGATLRIDPPLITSREELRSFAETLDGILAMA
ncbi:MAG: aminotransferase class III-fold pyridoxal phosphate-dependent enzyme [Actinomycetia bacterium]|nr:aminotransferase class III-fold pyridoxal phosphate-dependent enzyme [Actinomycetes bacterium]